VKFCRHGGSGCAAIRVVVLEGGKIVQSGPHARLVKEEGLYRRLVERQFARDVG
jgi:ABC-type multidrug transport system fused ATPase/permease subunit